MKFIVDTMLGRLAKWLRILGFDTFYNSSAHDDEIIDLCIKEDGIILTRDTLFAERLTRKGMDAKFLLISHNDLEGQLQEIFKNLHPNLSIDSFFDRCVVCNSPLKPIPKSQVKDLVPPYVFATQDDFSTCLNCSRIYWSGTHRLRMAETIDRVLRGCG